jgi:exoribonuclease R
MSDTNYTIFVSDRDYTNYTINPLINGINALTIDPIANKLFHDDIFKIDESLNQVCIIDSPTRNNQCIAGVLILEQDKTFGRTDNKKRLLYKCIPNNKHLPIFLIPYNVKIGFSKVYVNKFVTFKYNNWDTKHPTGILVETIGNVDDPICFHEYQLRCNNLNIQLTEFTQVTKTVLKSQSIDEFVDQIFKNTNYNFEDRRDKYIFSIDPEGSKDLDDALSIEMLDNCRIKITVYIANVFVWIDALNLWNNLTDRVSTIYLPDKRRTMLPTILSESLCSLLQKTNRFALAMEVIIKDGIIEPITQLNFKNVLINVNKNYIYGEPALMKNSLYIALFNATVKLNSTVKDSHDLVAHWMTMMNLHTGKLMELNGIGIFRTATLSDSAKEINQTLSDDAARLIYNWNNAAGKYVVYKKGESREHQLIKTDAYVHITSPIRRIVDLINQILLMRDFGLVHILNSSAIGFLKKWIPQIENINRDMRSIRKIQNDCELLDRCTRSPDVINNKYKGIIFDKTENVSGDGYKYMVYIEQLKMISKIKTEIDYLNYDAVECSIYVFNDEDTTQKKLRVCII